LEKMRANLVAVIAAASMTALSSCAYAPTEPARSYSYAAPLPLAAPTPPSYRPCDRGWHWVHGRQTRSGRWIEGHCARNVAHSQRRRPKHAAPAAHAPRGSQPPAAPWANPAPETPSASPPPAERQ
jgi:hypothetical protein